MSIQTIEQKRAKYALNGVCKYLEQKKQELEKNASSDKEFKAKFNKYGEEFKARANEIPAMIHMNGLGQTCAFYLSKGVKSEPHKKLYDMLSEWLCNQQQIYSHNDLLTGITHNNMHRYRIAQAEAQALLIWVKKFANVYCGDQTKAEEVK